MHAGPRGLTYDAIKTTLSPRFMFWRGDLLLQVAHPLTAPAVGPIAGRCPMCAARLSQLCVHIQRDEPRCPAQLDRSAGRSAECVCLRFRGSISLVRPIGPGLFDSTCPHGAFSLSWHQLRARGWASRSLRRSAHGSNRLCAAGDTSDSSCPCAVGPALCPLQRAQGA